MYILKNAWRNIVRKKGRNIMIGIIIFMITVGVTVGLTIYKSSKNLVDSYRNNNLLEVGFTLDSMSFKQRSEETTTLKALTIEDIEKYADSKYVKDYYYTEETTLSSNQISAVTYESDNSDDTEKEGGKGPGQNEKMNAGDYRLTGYSDPSYITEFIEGTNKIKEGSIFSKESTEWEAIISEALAEANSITVGEEITFYNPSDTSKEYTFKVIGIYEDNSDVQADNFMNMNAMNTSNKIYTNYKSVEKITSDTSTTETSRRGMGISAKIYLHNNDDIDAYEKEVRSKGLDDAYTVSTNEDQIMATIKPIENISHFSFTFLIIILIVGATILGVINLIHIRERKYEIGVLRAIGMSKKLVSLSFITEIFIVAMISLMLGTATGALLSQPITSTMLESEISTYTKEKEQSNQNFGQGGFENTRMNNRRGGEQNIDYVDSLTVKVDVLTVLEVFLVSLILTLTTSVISIFFINRYEPNKILQNR